MPIIIGHLSIQLVLASHARVTSDGINVVKTKKAIRSYKILSALYKQRIYADDFHNKIYYISVISCISYISWSSANVEAFHRHIFETDGVKTEKNRRTRNRKIE